MTNPELGHGKSPTEVQPTSSELQYDFLLLERLKTLKPTFVEIKSRMRSNSNVGFGSIPKFHPETISTAINAALRKTKNGKILFLGYSIEDMVFQREYEVTEEDKSRIIVMPDFEAKNPYIVSIYQKPLGNHVFDERLLYLSDVIIEGKIAHELAHLFADDDILPKNIDNFLDKKILQKRDDESDLGTEGVYDVIASLFGFKEQILAMLYDMKSFVLLHSVISPLTTRYLDRTIQGIDVRVRMVNEYCP